MKVKTYFISPNSCGILLWRGLPQEIQRMAGVNAKRKIKLVLQEKKQVLNCSELFKKLPELCSIFTATELLNYYENKFKTRNRPTCFWYEAKRCNCYLW